MSYIGNLKLEFRIIAITAASILWLNLHKSYAQCEVDAGSNITICAGESVTLGGNPTVIDAANPYTISWNNGAGNDENPDVSPNNTTTYTVTLTDNDNCSDTDQVTVTVLPSPNAGFNFGPDGACAGAQVTFTNTTNNCPGCQYEWDFDNPASGASNTSTANNPSHVFVAVGGATVTFDVSLTVTASNGCSDTQIVQVDVQQSPDAVLTEDVDFIQCLGIGIFEAFVTDDSSPANNQSYSIEWGDGTPNWNSNNAPNFLQHTYTGLDIFELVYTVTGNNGCQDTETYDVTNISNPAIGAANPGNTLQCGPVEFCFPLTNYPNNHPSTVYILDFGDGSPTQIINHPPPVEVCHTYSTSSCGLSPAFFTFSIQAQNNCPTASVATISPIQIHTPPEASFYANPEPGCVNSPITFVNTTIPGFNLNCSGNTAFEWDFGDGSPVVSNINGGNVAHTYTAPGTYTVTLNATNAGNPALACGETFFQQDVCIETPPSPVFTLSETLGCLPLTSAVDNTSDNGIPCNLTRNWIIDYVADNCSPNTGTFNYTGGTNASSLEPIFQFTSVGTYTVTLQMINSCGTFIDNATVQVNTVPLVNINPIPNICAGESINPSALIDNCNSAITLYNWQMIGGNPASSAAASPGSVSYANQGNYNVNLTVTNGCGPSSASEPFTVEASPIIAIQATDIEICQGQQVTLTASGAVSYNWVAAPGILSTNGNTAIVQPSSTTTYTVNGFSAAGCPGTEDITITVNPLPTVVSNGPYAICVGDDVQISGTINGGTMPIVQYSWSPAQGLSATNIANPIADPIITTNYQLTVTDSEGCLGTGTIPVVVNPLPVVEAGPNAQLCNQPVPELLSGYSPIIGGTGEWTGIGITNANTGEFTPPGIGNFILTYTFENNNGCINSDQVTITVIDPSQADAGPDLEFCASPLGIQLQVGGTWSGNNVTPGGLFTPSPAGTYNLTYSIGGGSCLSTDQMEVTVFPLPIVNADLNVQICEGDSVQLGAGISSGNPPYVSFNWSPDLQLSDNAIIDPWASPSSTTIYTLTVTDDEGCSSTDTQTVTVNSSPIVQAGPDLVLCNQPLPEILVGSSPANGDWSGPGVSIDGIFTPSGIGEFIIYYTFTAANGCVGVDSLTIDVINPSAVNAGPNVSLCLNEPAFQLPLPGTWSGNNVSPGGLFTPSQSGIFTVTLTLGNGTCATTDQAVVVVHALPIANAGIDVAICVGDTVQISGSGVTSNPPILLYSWSGGPGLSSNNIQSPFAFPIISTTYNLTIIDSEGCVDADQIQVFVNQLPIVNAGPNLVLCDQPIEEVLTGFSPLPIGASIGEWTGTGIVDPDGAFLSPGTGVYTLTYTFTNAVGCVKADSIEVTVLAPQIAEAGPDLQLCLNQGEVQFLGFSPLVGGTWTGAGIIDDQNGIFDPIVSGSGFFWIYFEFGTGTCYSIDSLEIEVHNLPLLDAGLDETICGNLLPFNLSGFDPPLGTWEGTGIIDAQLGTFDPGIGAGNYNLIYWYQDAITGCADTVNKVVTVHPVPNAIFNVPAQECTNAPAAFANTSTGANSYTWDFGNNATAAVTIPNYTYPDPGNYDIELIAFNQFGCSDTTNAQVEINDPPISDFSIDPAEGCAPLEVSFDNTSYGEYVSYNWDLDIAQSNDTIPAPLIYTQGNDVVVYNISLTVTNYCGSSAMNEDITVNPQPIAGFGTNLDVFCSPFTVEFNNISVGNPDDFAWNFGDGTTTQAEEPGTHIYYTDSVITVYTITLITSNECGIDTFAYDITVLPNNVTSFFNTNVTIGCEPLTVEFTDFSEGGTIITYDFGNNDITDEANPVHVFNEPGIHIIFQYVNNGCSFDTSFIQIEVLPGPDLDFSIEQDAVCENVPVQFWNLSQNVSDVSWDFGDGTQSEEANPLHSYQDNNTYTVTLFGTSSLNECPGQVQQNFTVYVTPTANFSADQTLGCSPLTVQFNNNSFGANFYTWDFGDGNTDNEANPSHTFVNGTPDPLLFEVELISQNLQLCADTFYLIIIVSPVPIAAFDMSIEESCDNPQLVQFFNESQYGSGYDWDFADAGLSQNFEPQVSFSGIGTYEISLTVSNAYGCAAVATDDFVIHPMPLVAFDYNPANGCSPLVVSFTNNSAFAETYEWDFGDFGSSQLPNPNHVYFAPGTYDVTLVVTTENGCVDELEMEDAIEVYPLPVAYFTYSPESTDIYNPLFEFTDQSTGAILYFWSFGDGGVEFEPFCTHYYQNAGVYEVLLTVVNEYGCESRHTELVLVEDDFNFYVPNAFTPDGDGTNDVFLPILLGGELEFYEFKIFDRWGEKIFETNDPDQPWTGNYMEGDYYVKDDVYVWQAKIRLRSAGESKMYFGHVTMLR